LNPDAPAASLPRVERTPRGETYRVRPIRRDDARREREFILALSPESRFQRLLYTLREPSDDFIAHLVDVDGVRDMALVDSARRRRGRCRRAPLDAG
jgi:acetyltransferase